MPKLRSTPASSYQWRALPPMRFPRASPVALPLEDGRLLIVGKTGWIWDDKQGTTRRDDLPPEVLDASRSEWQPATELVKPDGTLAGVTGQCWQPREQKWVSCLRVPDRPSIGSLQLPDGLELVVGGKEYRSNEEFPTALDTVLFRPVSGAPLSRRLRIPRIRAALTPLADGRVLVTGGYRVDVYFYNHDKDMPAEEAEIIDPIKRTVTLAGRLAKPRDEHGIAVFPDGSIILVGGRDHASSSLAEAEIGEPARKN
jgi:hypothetical protein